MTTIDVPMVGVFLERPNRFLTRVRLDSGEVVHAYLPNTARLTGLLVPGSRVILRPVDDPARKTRFTLTRVWEGVWVALDASRAPELLVPWLLGHGLTGFGAVTSIRREVTLGRHRLDLLVETQDAGEVWIEVKSGSRAVGGAALLSGTPSERGVQHLEALARLVADGRPAAVAFVVQRSDARRLDVGGDADPSWIDAVSAARDAGVVVLAYGCRVAPDEMAVDRELPIEWTRRGLRSPQ